MTYNTVLNTSNQSHGDIYNDTVTGISTSILTSAFNRVKARVKAAGLTPPAIDDSLAEAELLFAKADLLWKGRMMGDIPTGPGGAMSTYDNINKSRAALITEAEKLIDQYISSVSTDVMPSDTAGQTRADVTGSQFKLDQSDISGFT
jgi:hypothetical protein